MKKYKTTDVLLLGIGGKIKLTVAQATARIESGHIKKIQKDEYEILHPITLKAGEEFEYDGEIPKYGKENLDEVSGNDLKELKKTAALIWKENKNQEQEKFPKCSDFINQYIEENK